MTVETYEVFGRSVTVSVPASVKEAVELIGEDKVLGSFVDHVSYHSVLGKIRTLVVKKCEEKFPGNKRITVKEGDKEVVDETDGKYIERLLADGSLDGDTLDTFLAESAEDEKANFVACAKAERREGGSVLPKKVKLFVDQQIAAGNAQKLADALSKGLGTPIPADDPLALAKAVHARQLAASRAAKLAEAAALKALVA